MDAEDVDEITDAIQRVVNNDSLVDQAAVQKMQTARERLDISVIRSHVIEYYQRILEAKTAHS